MMAITVFCCVSVIVRLLDAIMRYVFCMWSSRSCVLCLLEGSSSVVFQRSISTDAIRCSENVKTIPVC